MIVLVCGGRDYDRWDHGFMVLDRLHKQRGITKIIHGGARGADSLAHQWSLMRQVTRMVYHADWDEYGRMAGPMRNQQMLDDGHPDLVVAFPGGKGTHDMIMRAEKAGVEIYHAE